MKKYLIKESSGSETSGAYTLDELKEIFTLTIDPIEDSEEWRKVALAHNEEVLFSKNVVELEKIVNTLDPENQVSFIECKHLVRVAEDRWETVDRDYIWMKYIGNYEVCINGETKIVGDFCEALKILNGDRYFA